MDARITLATSTLLLLAACDGASTDPGLQALLRVEGAQFAPGALPDENGGPEVRDVRVPHNELAIGTRRERMTGALAPDANAVAIGREGDAGYWIVTAGLPTADEPELPAFSALLELSRATPPGPFAIELSAVDRKGRLGPRERLDLIASADEIEGELVIGLRWDTDADLDLHVIDPDGIEIWARNLNSFQPPRPGAPPADPNAWKGGGRLDFDSNAQCVIDGRGAENVFYAEPPPSGEYTVRVVTASLCGAPATHWAVEARLRGEVIGQARGIGVATDTREQPGAGAGATALEFAVP